MSISNTHQYHQSNSSNLNSQNQTTTTNLNISNQDSFSHHHHSFQSNQDSLTPSTPTQNISYLTSPSVSLSISSLSSTKPLHNNSSSNCSSACSSPPSYKFSTLPPFYSNQSGYRWPTPLRQIRSHPIQFFKSRFSQILLLTSIFMFGYFFGSRPSSHAKSSPASKQFARLVLRQPQIPFLVDLSTQNSISQNHLHSLHPSNQKIPSILHYVFGMSSDFGGKPFSFIHYASIQSAVQMLRPKEIQFHYHHLPTGWWFARAMEIDGFKLVKERDITEIYGHQVTHFAHKADIIRLEVLRDYGGIYLDLDVFVVKNFDNLLNSDVVMGQEARPHPTFSRRPGSDSVDEPVGLCNAIILAKPFSPFITRWLSSYRTFNHLRWADHSSVIPWELAQAHPDELTVLGPRAFFYPLWHEDDLWLVHKTTDWDFDRSGQFVYHAWSSISHSNYLQSLDPDRIHAYGGPEQGESSFTYFVRRFIHDSIRQEWRQAKSNRTFGL